MQRLFVRPTEAADALGLGRSTIYQLISAGELPAVRVGGSVRIPASALEAFAERCRPKPENGGLRAATSSTRRSKPQ